jgi:hypothetical protein
VRTYENKDELKNEINKSFAKYISEFNDIPEPLKDKRIDEVDRTPAENLAYQVGWTTLILKWEADESFRSKLPPIILSGISLVNYINGSQIHMHTCHCKS